MNAGKRLDYAKFLDANALKGARIGIARDQGFGISPKTDAVMESAIQAIKNAGATIIDNLNIGALESSTTGKSETTVLLFDFKVDVAAYLATRPGGGPKTLQDLIDFNNAHAAQELTFFGQELFITPLARQPVPCGRAPRRASIRQYSDRTPVRQYPGPGNYLVRVSIPASTHFGLPNPLQTGSFQT